MKREFGMPTIISNKDGTFGKTEEFNRSSHNDFATSKELRDREFSGMRRNSLTLEVEIWLLGNKEGSMSAVEIGLYPERWEELYSRIFALKDVKQITTEGN